jgi:ribosome-binding protein aMBF1 (putative translation factor)
VWKRQAVEHTITLRRPRFITGIRRATALPVRNREAQEHLNYIAANVRRLRSALGLSQAALAEKAGCNPRWLQDLEVGKVDLRIQTLVRLASALEAKPAQLLRPAKLRVGRPGRPRGAAAKRPAGRAAAAQLRGR